MNNSINRFGAAMFSAGLTPPDVIYADWILHRSSINKDGWHYLHDEDHANGQAGDLAINVEEPLCTWQVKSTQQITMNVQRSEARLAGHEATAVPAFRRNRSTR